MRPEKKKISMNDSEKLVYENISNENTTSSRQLIIHEIMGRSCGWLTAYTAKEYRSRLSQREFLPEILIDQQRWDIDAVYVPEMPIDFSLECERLTKRMDEKDSVNIFLSEGAGTETIINELESEGKHPVHFASHLYMDLGHIHIAAPA